MQRHKLTQRPPHKPKSNRVQLQNSHLHRFAKAKSVPSLRAPILPSSRKTPSEEQTRKEINYKAISKGDGLVSFRKHVPSCHHWHYFQGNIGPRQLPTVFFFPLSPKVHPKQPQTGALNTGASARAHKINVLSRRTGTVRARAAVLVDFCNHLGK